MCACEKISLDLILTMKKLCCFIVVLTVRVIAGCNVPPAMDQSSSLASDRPHPAPIPQFRTYTFPNEFSVSYPSGWYVIRTKNPSGTEPRSLVIIQNLKPQQFGGGQVPPNLIKTDIAVTSEAFTTVVNRTLQGDKRDISRLTRKGNLKVGEQQALRLWFSHPQVESIVTLVRANPTETITLASYYSKSNLAAIDIIQRLHWSLRVL